MRWVRHERAVSRNGPTTPRCEHAYARATVLRWLNRDSHVAQVFHTLRNGDRSKCFKRFFKRVLAKVFETFLQRVIVGRMMSYFVAMGSKAELVATAGWATLSCLVALVDDEELDIPELKKLLARVGKTIHEQPNRVRYVMNGFVISVGICVAELTDLALATGAKVGAVSVNMGDTACKVPDISEYIGKVRAQGTIGKKRKTVKC